MTESNIVWGIYVLDEFYNKVAESPVVNDCKTTNLKFDTTISNEDNADYTLILEVFESGKEGLEVVGFKLNDVNLNDLIHRRGQVFVNCTNDVNYIFEKINNDSFKIDLLPYDKNKENKNYRLLNYRHSNITGNNPRVYNNETGETTEYTGYLITDNGYVIKGKDLYYDATEDYCFIAEYANNENLYVEGDLYVPNFKYRKNNEGIKEISNILHRKKLIHHIPNSSCLSMIGRWEIKFKTPLYGWVVDNIFGDN